MVSKKCIQKVTRLRPQGMEVQCTQLEQRDYSRVEPKGKFCIRKYNQKVQLRLIDYLNLNVAKPDYHTGGTKYRKENQLQCLKHPCRLSISENIYQTKWKSIYSSIRSIIRKCKKMSNIIAMMTGLLCVIKVTSVTPQHKLKWNGLPFCLINILTLR